MDCDVETSRRAHGRSWAAMGVRDWAGVERQASRERDGRIDGSAGLSELGAETYRPFEPPLSTRTSKPPATALWPRFASPTSRSEVPIGTH